MESKETFGAYIQQRRRALGMTQREFADKLYVTESAVSKWERALSYPDITILRDICQILGVTEHELLTASVDTEARTTERLAKKYRRLTRNYRIIQYVLYGGTLLGCGIGNLCAAGRLDWFFIVLASVLLCASVTLLPSLLFLWGVPEKRIGAVCLLSALAALLLLLGVCCIYTGGRWFFVATSGVLLGFSILFVPFLLPQLPLPTDWERRKSSVCLMLDLAALLALLGVCCVYTGGNWFFVAASGVLLGFSILFVPFLLPQLPLPADWERRKFSVCLALDLAALLVLLGVCCIYTGGSWFFVAAISTVFGLGFFLLPVFLRQLPLPQALRPHKALLHFSVQSGLLAVLLAVTVRPAELFLREALPIAALCLLLPWGLLLLIRYLRANGFVRAGACCALTGLWIGAFPFVLDAILAPRYGGGINSFRSTLHIDFLHWTAATTADNVFALVLIVSAALAAGLVLAGVLKRKK